MLNLRHTTKDTVDCVAKGDNHRLTLHRKYFNMENKDTRISTTLKWYENIHKEVMNSFSDLINFANSFHKSIIEKKKKIPYNINVIDELHINENGHSRILYKLLQYGKEEHNYELLNSLMDYIKKKYPQKKSFQRIHVEKPVITQEDKRIDLWIRDSSYSIIFENKIYNAIDQESQLSRYIDKTKELSHGYKDSDIYIIYLSQIGQEPEAQTWGKYKDTFQERYLNLSFRNDVLPWLKEDVLPNIRVKDIYLHSAVLQYIDYLEGMFFLRNSNNKLLMDLTDLLKKELKLEDGKGPIENYQIIQSKLNDLNEVVNALASISSKYRDAIYADWKKRTHSMYPKLNPCQYNDYTDVSIPYVDGKNICVWLGTEPNFPLFCQVEFKGEKVSKDQQEGIINDNPTIMSLRDLLPEPKKNITNCIWQNIDVDDFDGAFRLFCQVVDRLEASIAKK